MATLTVALVVSVPVWLVLSIRSYVGWEIDRTLRLVGGVLLMGVASVAGILLARSAWRRTARPAVAVMGTSLALLVAVGRIPSGLVGGGVPRATEGRHFLTRQLETSRQLGAFQSREEQDHA